VTVIAIISIKPRFIRNSKKQKASLSPLERKLWGALFHTPKQPFIKDWFRQDPVIRSDTHFTMEKFYGRDKDSDSGNQ